MIKEKSIDRVRASKNQMTQEDETCRTDLIRVLTSVLKRLEGRPDGRVDSATNRARSFDRWEDESCCYFEMKLPAPPSTGIDVSVIHGRAFIRLER